MVDAELGTKRTCPSCAGRFYDLNNDPIVCPLCAETFVVEPILPSKADSPAAAKPAETKEEPKDDDEAAKAVNLEDAEDNDDDDDETAAVKDVDLGEDVEIDEKADSDAFLESDDDDDAPVAGIVGGSKPGDSDS